MPPSADGPDRLSANPQQAAGIGGLLAVEQALVGGGAGSGGVDAGDYVFTYDANGNVAQLLDLSATTVNDAIVAHYEYDPYGTVVNDLTGQAYGATNAWRFSTKPFDIETGLGYWGYRYYSPKLGRWMSRDPMDENGGVHLFAFNANLPTSRFDALGRLSLTPDSPPRLPPRGPVELACWRESVKSDSLPWKTLDYVRLQRLVSQIARSVAGNGTDCLGRNPCCTRERVLREMSLAIQEAVWFGCGLSAGHVAPEMRCGQCGVNALGGIQKKGNKKCIAWAVYRRQAKHTRTVHKFLVIWPLCTSEEQCGVVVDCWQWWRAFYCPRDGYDAETLVRPKSELPGGRPWGGEPF